MYVDTLDHFATVAREKADAARTPVSFLAGAALAGAYIGIAMILALTVAAGLPAGTRPLAMGAVFGIGLVLVIFAGAELFTGYALYCTVGLARGTVTLAETIRLLGLVWIGNLAGALILVGLFAAGGGGGVFSTPDFLSGYVAHKVDAGPVAILARAMLCNWLVCLAIWSSARVQGDTAKVIVMAWCLLAFVAPGFEHSVADMTALGLGLVAPGATLGLGPAMYDLIIATVGNIAGGGLFVAGAYLLAAQPKVARPAHSNDCIPRAPAVPTVQDVPPRKTRLHPAELT